MSRYFRVETLKQSVGLMVDHHRGRSPELDARSWLELHARLGEPVVDTMDATFSVYPDPDANVAPGPPPCIGAIISMKPIMQVVVSYPVEEFDRLWILATNSQVRTGYVAFTVPKRGKALVVTLDFSTSNVPDE